MAFLGRWGSLLALLPQRPREFYDRVALHANFSLEVLIAERMFGRPPQYREVASETVSWEQVLQDMEAYFDHIAEILGEPALSDIEKSVRRRYEDNRSKLPVDPGWGADPITGRCCYLACRLLKPTTVVECGVSLGVTSAYILKALEENDHGTLYSVDLPSLRQNFEQFWGIAVPEELKSRWKLYRGHSGRVLPKILEETEKVDFFVEEIWPTYRGNTQDFEIIYPHLQAGGMLIATGVDRNRAFYELQQRKPEFWRLVRDTTNQAVFGDDVQHVMFGIAIK